MLSFVRRASWPALVTLGVVGAIAAPAAASTGTPTPSPSPTGTAQATVVVHTGPMGKYLTDAKGRSLYRFAADTGTTSTCTGACASAWPPLLTNGTPTAGPGVTGKLTTTSRPGGGSQVSINGHPLYLFALDKTPGQTNGQGVNNFGGLWWLVTPNGANITGTGSPSPTGTMTESPSMAPTSHPVSPTHTPPSSPAGGHGPGY
jgi:predicted lipoprotein with Yx(FWY)xxD motif